MNLVFYRKLLLVGLAALLIVPLSVPLRHAEATEITEESNARNRMNHAGKERMLTQQIARNACFVMAGVDPDRYADRTQSNAREFDAVIVGLRNGDAELGILPETHEDVLRALAEVEALWSTLGPAAQQIASGDYHSVPMQQLIALNMLTLAEMQKTVEQMSVRYSDERISAELLKTVALAGRQRMLTQKASKELCFKTIGLEKEGAAALVEDTVAQFDQAMAKLMTGSEADGVLAPPTPQVAAQLRRAQALWIDFKALIAEIGHMEEVPHNLRVQLANMSDEVLREMDMAVSLYVQ